MDPAISFIALPADTITDDPRPVVLCATLNPRLPALPDETPEAMTMPPTESASAVDKEMSPLLPLEEPLAILT